MGDSLQYINGNVRINRSDDSFDSIDATKLCSLTVQKPTWNIIMVIGLLLLCGGLFVGTLDILLETVIRTILGILIDALGGVVFMLGWLLRTETITFRTVDGVELSAEYSAGTMDEIIEAIEQNHLRQQRE